MSGAVSDRCQQRKVVNGETGDAEQCRLPALHRCECVFVGEPLSLIQGLAWREEVRAAEVKAFEHAMEMAARTAHRFGSDDVVDRIRNMKNYPPRIP